MITLISLLILVQETEPDVLPPEKLDWHTMDLQRRGVDPTANRALPDFGYVGLWRTIYGTREEQEEDVEVESVPGFAITSDLDIDLPEIERRRRPRIRAARRLFQAQPWYNRPAFDVPIKRLDDSVATFVWDHQLEQSETIWSPDTYVMAPTSTPRDYLGNSPVLGEETEGTEDESGGTNIYMTVLIAFLAMLLLVVIICMPR